MAMKKKNNKLNFYVNEWWYDVNEYGKSIYLLVFILIYKWTTKTKARIWNEKREGGVEDMHLYIGS